MGPTPSSLITTVYLASCGKTIWSAEYGSTKIMLYIYGLLNGSWKDNKKGEGKIGRVLSQ